ncbi:MAG: hypothetical protein ACRDOI_09690 [Trebonia sp.]
MNGFVVGDIGRRTPDGLVIVGRLANCVNVGGTKVSPEEVEAVLLEFPTVRPDPRRDGPSGNRPVPATYG